MKTIVRIEIDAGDWLTIDMGKINSIRINPHIAILYLDGVKTPYMFNTGTLGHDSIVTLERHWRGEMDEETKKAIAALRHSVFLPGDTAHD